MSSSSEFNRTRILVPSGVLGLGFDRKALADGVLLKPDLIAIDGGSTDSGPAYLGTGKSKYAHAVTTGEWRELLDARHAAGCPLVIGSAGTCGVDAQVNSMLEITRGWSDEHGVPLRIATLCTEITPRTVLTSIEQDRLSPLGSIAVNQSLVDAIADCTHIVALAGAEPIAAALAAGADVVIAGRTTDTALFAALPIARGADPGAAWHAAKTVECGALCSTAPASGVVIVDIDDTGFTVNALGDGAVCTPYTISAHMLYENTDPVVLYEPGGHLDVSYARYVESGSGVRVTGSQWITDDRYTVKLEGARRLGQQCSSLVLVREPRYVEHIDRWCHTLEARLREDVARHLGAIDYTLELRRIGRDATLGAAEFDTRTPVEIGVLLLVTAASDELALSIAQLANPLLLHHGLPEDTSMPSFAFPYTPAETPRGSVFAFCLDHVMSIDHWSDACRLDVIEHTPALMPAQLPAHMPAMKPA